MNVDAVSHNLVKSCYAMLDYNLKFQSPFYNILQHLKLRKTLYLNWKIEINTWSLNLKIPSTGVKLKHAWRYQTTLWWLKYTLTSTLSSTYV